MEYPDTVLFEVDGGSFPGCGGAVRRTASIVVTVWEVVRLGDLHPPEPVHATLSFRRDGHVTASLYCNDYSTEVRFDGESFSVEGVGIITTQGCAPDRRTTTFDELFITAVPKIRRWQIEDEILLLETEDGRQMELRRLV